MTNPERGTVGVVQNTNQDETEDRTGNHRKNGLPKRIEDAHDAAPDSATESAILQVAKLAHDRQCHPREIWKEGVENAITDYGGGGR